MYNNSNLAHLGSLWRRGRGNDSSQQLWIQQRVDTLSRIARAGDHSPQPRTRLNANDCFRVGAPGMPPRSHLHRSCTYPNSRALGFVRHARPVQRNKLTRTTGEKRRVVGDDVRRLKVNPSEEKFEFSSTRLLQGQSAILRFNRVDAAGIWTRKGNEGAGRAHRGLPP